MPAPISAEELDARLATVRRVAMDLFAERGFRATSMAAIATAAGLSRPALYQHFANREDVFRSALEDILTTANERALEELRGPGALVDRIDGYLQRCRGDVIGPLLQSPHSDELLEARGLTAGEVADRAHRQRRDALDAFLLELTDGDRTPSRRAAELLELGSLGLKHDSPTPQTYRKRLRALAEATAAMLASSPIGTPTPGPTSSPGAEPAA